MTPTQKKLAMAAGICAGLYFLQNVVENQQVKAVCFGAIGSVLVTTATSFVA